AGGAILALSALFGDWGALTGSRDPEDGSRRSRMARFEEVMSGREALDDTGDSTSASADEGASDEETADEVEPSTLRPKGRRMRRFEEIMSGRPIPDPEAEAEPESADPEQ